MQSSQHAIESASVQEDIESSWYLVCASTFELNSIILDVPLSTFLLPVFFL